MAHQPQRQEEGIATRIPPEGGGEGAEEEIGDTPHLELEGIVMVVEGEGVEVCKLYSLYFQGFCSVSVAGLGCCDG